METKNPTQAAPESQAAVQQEVLTPIVRPTETAEYLMSPIGQEVKKFELTQRKALMFANSSMVPATFRGQANVGNCIIALEMADRLGCSPMMLMQNMYVVHGTPALSAQMKIALFESTGRYQNIEHETVGQPGSPSWGMRAYTYRSTDVKREHPIYGPVITLKMAADEKWGDKWRTIPEKMMLYRSSSWMIDVVDPSVSFGLRTVDEVEDTVEFEEVKPNDFQQVAFDEPATAPAEEPKPKQPEKPAPKPQPAVAPAVPTKDSLFA